MTDSPAEEKKVTPPADSASAPAQPPAAPPKPAPKPAPAAGATPPAKPPAKPKVEKKPLIDNGDGTITDPNSGLMWKQTDAWLDMHIFYTWPNHQEYVDKFNQEKFAGHSDWRIPSKADAMTLVEKGRKETVIDKNGTPFPLDPLFTEGCVSNTWISECSEEEVIRFDFKIGSDFKYPPSELWASIRLMRKADGSAEEAAPAAEKSALAPPVEKPGTATVAPAAEKPATATAAPAVEKPATATAAPAAEKPAAAPEENK